MTKSYIPYRGDDDYSKEDFYCEKVKNTNAVEEQSFLLSENTQLDVNCKRQPYYRL